MTGKKEIKIIRVDDDLLKFLKRKNIDLAELEKRGFAEGFGMRDVAVANLDAVRRADSGLRFSGRFDVDCIRPDGSLRWRDHIDNLVVNEGLDYALDVVLPGGQSPIPYIQSWYVGLSTGLTSPLPSYAAGDTMSSHSGWAEFTNYTGANSPEERPALVMAAASSQSKTNSASVGAFSINQDSSNIDGCFISSGSVKGATAGTLFSAGQFTGGNKPADNGDTLNVTYTLNATTS